MEPEEVGVNQSQLPGIQAPPTGSLTGQSSIPPTGSLAPGGSPGFSGYQSYLNYVAEAEGRIAKNLIDEPDDETFFQDVADFASGTLRVAGATARGLGTGVVRLVGAIDSINAVVEQQYQDLGIPIPSFAQWRVKKLNDIANAIGRSQLAERGANLVINQKNAIADTRADLGEDWGVAGRVIDSVRNTVSAIVDVMQDDPAAASAFVGDMLGSNAPQLAALMAVSVATGGAAIPTALAGVGLSTGFQTNDAIIDPVTNEIRRVSIEQAGIALASGTAAGLLDALGIGNISKMANAIAKSAKISRAQQISLSRQITNSVVAAGKGGAGESVTETLQTVIENAGAKAGWDPDRAFEEGVGEAAIIGAILGSGASVVEARSNRKKLAAQQLRDGILSDDDTQASLPAPAPSDEDLDAYREVISRYPDDVLAQEAVAWDEGDPRIDIANQEIEARAAAAAAAEKSAPDVDQPTASPNLFDGTVQRDPAEAGAQMKPKSAQASADTVEILQQRFDDAEAAAIQEAQDLGLDEDEADAYIQDKVGDIEDQLIAAMAKASAPAAPAPSPAQAAQAQTEPAPAPAPAAPAQTSTDPASVAVSFFNSAEEDANINWNAIYKQGISVDNVSISNIEALKSGTTQNLRIKEDLRGDHLLVDGRFLVPAKKREMDSIRDSNFRILYDIDGIEGGGGDTISRVQNPVVLQKVEGSQNNEYTIVSKGELSYKKTSQKPAPVPAPSAPAPAPSAPAPAPHAGFVLPKKYARKIVTVAKGEPARFESDIDYAAWVLANDPKIRQKRTQEVFEALFDQGIIGEGAPMSSSKLVQHGAAVRANMALDTSLQYDSDSRLVVPPTQFAMGGTDVSQRGVYDWSLPVSDPAAAPAPAPVPAPAAGPVATEPTEPTPEPAQANPLTTEEREVYNLTSRWAKEQGDGSVAKNKFETLHADGNASPDEKRSFINEYADIAQDDSQFGWDVKDTPQGKVLVPRVDVARLRYQASRLTDEALVTTMEAAVEKGSYPARLAYADEAVSRGIPVTPSLLAPADVPPLSQDRVNRLKRKQLISEATTRGFENADQADSATLYEFLTGGPGIGSVADQLDPLMSEAQALEFIILNTESKTELISAIEDAKTFGAEIDLQSTPSALFFEWMKGSFIRNKAGKNVRAGVKINEDAFAASYGPMLEGTPGARKFLTKTTAREARAGVAGTSATVYTNLSDLLSDFNAENDTNITEDEAISFMQQGSPGTTASQQLVRDGLDRYKEMTGSSLTASVVNTFRRTSTSQESANAQLDPSTIGIAQQIIADAGVSLDDPMAVLRFADDLEIPFGRPEALDGLSEENIRQIAEEIRNAVHQQAAAANPSAVTAEEVTGAVETDGEKSSKTEGDKEADVIFKMSIIPLPDFVEKAIDRWVSSAIDVVKKADYSAIRKKMFRSGGAADPAVFNRMLRRDQMVASHSKRAEFIARDLRQKYALYNKGFDKESPSQLRALRAFLKGEGGLHMLPGITHNSALQMRRHIDAMSKYLIESGATPDEISLVIDQNMGIYLNRSFRAHTDSAAWTKEFWGKIEKGDIEAMRVLNVARAHIKHRIKNAKARKHADNVLMQLFGLQQVTRQMRKNPFWQGVYADAYANYNVTNEAADSRIRDKYFSSPDRNVFGRSKSQKLVKNLGVLKKRRNLRDWELALLGEHLDPRFNYVQTISKISMLAETHLMLKDFRDSMPGIFLNEDQFNASNDPNLVKISAEGNEKMAPLDGYYVDKDTAAFLQNTLGPQGAQSPIIQAYLKGQSYVKMGKTVYSFQTQARNLVGASLTIPAQGHLLSPKSIWKNGKLMTDFGVKSKKGTLNRTVDFAGTEYNAEELMIEITRLGILNDTAGAGEISALLKDIGIDNYLTSLVDPSSNDSSTDKAIKDGIIRKPQQFYALSDNIFKLELLEKEVASLKKIYPSKAASPQGMQEIFQEAAEIVRNQSPTYSLVSPFAQSLRRVVFIGPFVSYSYESVRNAYHTIKRSHYEYNEGNRTGNKEMKKRGLQRALGLALTGQAPMIAYSSLGMAMAALGGSGFLGDEKDEAAVRRLAPPFYQHSQIVPITRDENGNVVYTVASYANIHSAWQDPIASMYRAAFSETWDDATVMGGMARGLLQFLAPYVQEEILFGALVGSFTGRARDGKVIWQPDDPLLTKSLKGAEYFAKTISPGVFIQVGNLISKDKTFSRELTAIATGTRLTDLNLAKSAAFKGYEFSRDVAKGSSELNKVLRNVNSTEEDIASALADLNRRRMEAFGNAYMDFDAISYLSRSPISDALRKSSIGKTNIAILSRGMWRPYSNTASIDEDIRTAEDSETRDALRRNKAWLRAAMAAQGRGPQPLPTKYFNR